MKKLNRKGFTLVELLAVIVILAIVVGIAIPSVTKVINTSKRKGFETQLEAAAAYLKKQAQLMNVDPSALDDGFKKTLYTGIGAMHTLKIDEYGGDYSVEDSKKLIDEMGIELKNVSEIWVCITSDGKSLIQVNRIPLDSEYYTPGHWVENASGTGYVTSDVNTFAGDATIYIDEEALAAGGANFECR